MPVSHDRFANQPAKESKNRNTSSSQHYLIPTVDNPSHSTAHPLTPPLLLPRTPTALTTQTRPRTRPPTPTTTTTTTQTRALFPLASRTALPPALSAQRLQTSIYRSRQSVRRVRRIVGFPVDLGALVVGGEAGEEGEEVEAGLG